MHEPLPASAVAGRLTVATLNVDGLSGRLEQVIDLVESYAIDVLFVQVTYLTIVSQRLLHEEDYEFILASTRIGSLDAGTVVPWHT